MSEIYNDILRRVKRNALVLEVCTVVFAMGLYVPFVIWQDIREKATPIPEISPAAAIAWVAATVASAIIGLRAMKVRKRLQAEKAAYEKNSFVVPQRVRHLNRRRSKVLRQKIAGIRDAFKVNVVYDADAAAKEAQYVFQSAPVAYGAVIGFCVAVTVLVGVLFYAGLMYRYFTPSDQVKEIARMLALGAVIALCVHWYGLKKRGRIPRVLQHFSGWFRYAEAVGVLAAVAFLTYFIVAYGFAKLARDISG